MAKKVRTRKRNSFKRKNNIRRKNTNRTRRKVSRKSSRKQHRRKRTNRRRLNMRGGTWFQQSTPSAPTGPQAIKLYRIHVYPAGEKDKRKKYDARWVVLYWEPSPESLNDRVNQLISQSPDKNVYVHGDSIANRQEMSEGGEGGEAGGAAGDLGTTHWRSLSSLATLAHRQAASAGGDAPTAPDWRADSITRYDGRTFPKNVVKEPGFCISPPADTEFWKEQGDGIHIFPKSEIIDVSAEGKWGGEGPFGDWVLSMTVKAAAGGVNTIYRFRMNSREEYEKAVEAAKMEL